MGMGEKLRFEITDWGVLAMAIVVISVILLTLKNQNISESVCGGSAAYYNATLDKCCASSALCNAGNQSNLLTTGSFINEMVAGLSEPKNWLAIFIIGLIGFGLIFLFSKKRNS